MICYKFGDICFVWEGEFFLSPDSYTDRFLLPADPDHTQYDTVTFRSSLYPIERLQRTQLLQRNGTYELYKTDSGNVIIFHWAQCRFAYGFPLTELQNPNQLRLWFNEKMYNEIPLPMFRFLSTAGLHTKLLQRNAPILHASYIDCGGKAILFTAPSGTGKSTQADLWVRHAGAEIINGDRVLLRQRDGIWHAFGYPCCGSSDICLNRTLPLAAIVVLAQGPENRIEVMRPGEKVRALFGGIERYLWDPTETDLAFSLARQITLDIPILRLVCRPDEDAVLTLRNFLSQEGLI